MTETTAPAPRAGDVWSAYLDPVVGHEQHGNRPVVIVSANWFNDATGGTLVLTVPLTTTRKPYLTRIPINASEANLAHDSWAMCEQMRALSSERFKRKRGEVSAETLRTIRKTINALLEE